MSGTEIKQVIVMRSDLKMRRGKECAQAAHAAMSFLSKRLQQTMTVDLPDLHVAFLTQPQRLWLGGSFRKVTVRVHSEDQLMEIHDKAEIAGLEVHLITDSGITEFHGIPTPTCLAIGPDYDERIDPVTGNLELY